MGGAGVYVEVPAELRQGWAPFNGPKGQVGSETNAKDVHMSLMIGGLTFLCLSKVSLGPSGPRVPGYLRPGDVLRRPPGGQGGPAVLPDSRSVGGVRGDQRGACVVVREGRAW